MSSDKKDGTALVAKQAAKVLSSYFSSAAGAPCALGNDTKEPDPSKSLQTRASKDIRRGLKQMRVSTPLMYAISNTAANLSQYVTVLNPVNSNEWTSLQALYDEYRFIGAHVQVVPLAGSQGASLNLDCGWLCVGYDPTDSTIYPNVASAVQQAQAGIFAIPVNVNAGTGPSSTLTGGKPLSFRVSVDKKAQALSFSSTGTVDTAPGMWRNLPTAGSTVTHDGYLKVFWKTDAAGTSAVVASVIVRADYEFRCRH